MVGVGLGGVPDGVGKIPVGRAVSNACDLLAYECMRELDNGMRRAVAIMTNAAKANRSFDLRGLFMIFS